MSIHFNEKSLDIQLVDTEIWKSSCFLVFNFSLKNRKMNLYLNCIQQKKRGVYESLRN